MPANALQCLAACRSTAAGGSILHAPRRALRPAMGCVLVAFFWLAGHHCPCSAAPGELELHAIDDKTDESVAVTMSLIGPRGRPVFGGQRLRLGPFFAFDGVTVLRLPPGAYRFTIDRGPQWRPHRGQFLIRSGAADNHTVRLIQVVRMADEHWWSGDIEAVGPIRHPEIWIRARDLNLLAISTAAADPPGAVTRPGARMPTGATLRRGPIDAGSDRRVTIDGQCDTRSAGRVYLFPGASGKPISRAPVGSRSDGPTSEDPRDGLPLRWIRHAMGHREAHLHVSPVYHADLPVWVATRCVDTVALLSPEITVDEPSWPVDRPTTPVGRAPDRQLYPGPRGPGRWAADVYFHLLDTGHRIAPAAGSRAGQQKGQTLSNPVGYHRTYVVMEHFSVDRWWRGLAEGRVVVTNGPLLRPLANGKPPGTVFYAAEGETVSIEMDIRLATAEKIEYLEVIKNGQPAQQIRLEDWAAQGGRLPMVEFRKSGWLLVRVVTTNPNTYRAAVSGPFYVQIGSKRRISRRSSKFFIDWIDRRAEELQLTQRPETDAQRVLYASARRYWQRRLQSATAP